MPTTRASTISTLHRKAKTGLIRCDGYLYRVHDMEGYPFSGEVTLLFDVSKLSAHKKA